MTERRFQCTACGLCCYGLLPLTINEAIAKSDTFPLAMSITPIKPGARGYSTINEIAAPMEITRKRSLFLLITPVSFVPATMGCPELSNDGLCNLHPDKPLRCKTMPFYPYKDETHQGDLLTPRKDWQCATGEDAPIVYKHQQIAHRHDFDQERQALVDQAPSLRRYVELLLQHNPVHRTRILKASKSTIPGRVVISFVSYLRYNKDLDLLGFANKQRPVLQHWADKTAGLSKFKEHNRYYVEALSELERYKH